MKILFLTTSARIGGAEKNLLLLVRNLKDYDVLVLTLKNDGLLVEELKKANIKTFSLDIKNKWQFFKIFRLNKIIKNFQPDVLQTFLFYDNVLGRVLGKISKVPFVISGQRNVETERSFWRNFLDKITTELCNLIVANSKAGKKILIEREKVPEEKIRVIYNGIDLKNLEFLPKKEAKNKLGIPDDRYIIGCIAKLEKQKGLEYLIEAAHILDVRCKMLDVRWIIIGEGKERPKLEALIKKYNLENRVSLLGYLPDAIDYLKAFDVFVLPSLWEGMPNVLLEAMAAEIPIVATDVGGVSEIIENKTQGLIIEPKNASELSTAIKTLVENKEMATKMVLAAKKKINNFSLEKMIKNYQNLYSSFS